MERTLNRINLNSLNPYLITNDRIILTSIEKSDQNDFPILALIEDRITEKLISLGFHVLERDKDLLPHIIKEKGKIEPELSQSGLTIANKMIAYRVEEYGFNYRPNLENKSSLLREGLIKLQIRVINLKTGTLLFADEITTNFQDEVDLQHRDEYHDFAYESITPHYPIIKTSDSLKQAPTLKIELPSAFDQMLVYSEPQWVYRSGSGNGFGARYGFSDMVKRYTAQLYYSTAETNHYLFAVNYDRLIVLPKIGNYSTFKLNTRIGASYNINYDEAAPGFLLGLGLEYSVYGMQFQLGYNHNVPLIKSEKLWSKDVVLSIGFSY